MKTASPGSFRFYLTAGACLLLLPLKLVQGWNAVPAAALFSSWVADACFLLLLAVFGAVAGGAGRVRRLALGGAVFVGLQLPAFVVIAAHTYFLQDSVSRRWALLDASPSLVRYFLVEVVPRGVMLAAAAVLVALSAAAWLAARRWPAPRPLPAFLVLAALSAGVYVHQARYDFYPTVLWEVGTDLAEIFSHPATSGPRQSDELANTGTGYRAAWPDHPRFDKVIVFVMESVPLHVLEDETRTLPADSFFRRALQHAHSYANYFTTNMDSRTGMMSMLFSRIVPYEAYTEEDVEHYAFMRDQRSMVDDMAAHGYATAVAASQIDEEVVVHELESWDTRLMLSHDEYDHPGSFLCLNPYQFEQGCEDKILLPKIDKALDAHPRLFLFQEAVYGHDEEYERTIAQTSIQYYNEHLQAIEAHLAARGELDRTLFVITSDHGPRGGYDSTRRLSYRLPLLFLSTRFEREVRPEMYNQSDFAALLAAELGGTAPPPARQVTIFVGPTNTSILGSITAEGDLLVVRDRRWSSYVLTEGNCPGDLEPAAKPRHAVSSAALVGRFNDLRSVFRPGMGPVSPALTRSSSLAAGR